MRPGRARAFGHLRQQQVLDQDPYSGQVVFFGGITNDYALIVVQGQGDYLEQCYDVQSGLLAYSRYRVNTHGLGAQITELQLVGQQ